MARDQVVVVGLGRFGFSLAEALSNLGYEVLALDKDAARVENASDIVTQAIQLDVTDEDALREAGVGEFAVAAVAIGSDIKSSILSTLLLKRLGVKMVIAKAQDQLHGEILSRVGADRVVYPERETAVRLAHGFSIPALVDYLEVMPGYGIAKLEVPERFVGRTLGEIDLKGKYDLTVLVKGSGGDILINPGDSELLRRGEALVVFGEDRHLEGLRGT